MLNSFSQLTPDAVALSPYGDCGKTSVSGFNFMGKKCSDCKQTKETSKFSLNRCQKDGLSNICKKCSTERGRHRTTLISQKNKDSRPFISSEEKLCKGCNTIKHKSLFSKNKAKPSGIVSRCKECTRSASFYRKSSDFVSAVSPSDLQKERWVDMLICGNNTNYMVSDCGRVLIKRKNKIAKLSLDQRGYPQIVVVVNGNRIGRRVHILVAEHFISAKPIGMQVNHIDGNKSNPHFTNLEWVTSKQNVAHAVSTGLLTGLSSEEHGMSKRVFDTATGEIYSSIAHAVRVLKIQNLYKILGGYIKNTTTLKYYE